MTKRPAKRHTKPKDQNDDPVWLYGRHACAAALKNPARLVRDIAATKNALDWLQDQPDIDPSLSNLETSKPDAIDKLLPRGAVHQGLALFVDPLPRARLKDVCAPAEAGRPVVVLDQVTDPQNIGAVLRAAAALNSRAVIVQDRRTPPIAGAMTKAAAGAVEILPIVRVVNIARALEALRGLGYFCAGLAGAADAVIQAAPKERPVALVMGAEGAGLRPLVAEGCDQLVKIDIATEIESLNVAAAAAISLYELNRREPPEEQ